MHLVNIIKVFIGITSLSLSLLTSTTVSQVLLPKSVLKSGVCSRMCFSPCQAQLRLVSALFAEAGGGVVE